MTEIMKMSRVIPHIPSLTHIPIRQRAFTHLWQCPESRKHSSFSSRTPESTCSRLSHLNIQNLADCSRETTLRRFRCSLHEDYQRVLLYGLFCQLDPARWPPPVTSHTERLVIKLTPSMSFRASSESHRRCAMTAWVRAT